MGQRILVVDDEDGIVLLLKDYLELQGYKVITAGGGMEALEKISREPDLILLDINMPDMDGLSVCRKIRAQVNCPIIFLSARAEEQDRITGLMLGGDGLYCETVQYRRTWSACGGTFPERGAGQTAGDC